MGILDDALESASRVLTVHDLLTGFVTAFISIYDAADGMLSYAACGHEPGIVLRADGRTELIGAPGPPLGVAGMPKCDVNRVGLEPGDTIILYTDGLTESGVSRQELLGSDGLAKLVAELPRCNDPKCLGEAIMSAASSRSGGKFHDDVCLLIATRSA
jgi:sigma-B regulation protein RsbU (phosphoserine phosphatase)